MAHAEIYPTYQNTFNTAVTAARQLLSQVPALPCPPPAAKPKVAASPHVYHSPLGQGDQPAANVRLTPLPPSLPATGSVRIPNPPTTGAPTAPSQEVRSSAAIPPQVGTERAPGPERPRFQLQYQGRTIETQYELQRHNDGTPIDVYYYEVRGPDNKQYVQDGTPLWGRFVRMPAAGHAPRSTATWSHLEWVFRDGKWLENPLLDVSVEGLRPSR